MTMTSEKWTHMDNHTMSASCNECHNDSFLLVPDTDSLRFCIHFRLLTPNLVACSTGKPLFSAGGLTCSEDEHVLLHMPLIANRWRGNTVNTCPLGGTYTFHATEYHQTSPDNSKGDPLCPGSAAPSLIEIECKVGEGMRMKFVDPSCVPVGPAWRMEKTFYCLGSWTPGKSDHTAVILGDDRHRPRWCMTYPREHGDTFSIRLYEGLDCWTSATQRNVSFIEFQVHRLAFDLSESCLFDEAVVTPGTWAVLADNAASRPVTLTNRSLSVRHDSPFYCERRVGQDVYIVRLQPHNGCRPQKACAAFDRPSRAIILHTYVSMTTTNHEEHHYRDSCSKEILQKHPNVRTRNIIDSHVWRSRWQTTVIVVSSIASLLCLSGFFGVAWLLHRHKRHPYHVLVFSKLYEL
ncbi:hypothetical protein LSAT2_006973 [Lamellibrachia satsuma]|nr:hypothetical protein LSAT2_006973 [Lamellibrachia satsuma]